MPSRPGRACQRPRCSGVVSEGICSVCGAERRSQTAVTVVCGPPGSGKTTYVQGQRRWGDLVVDFDALMSALSGGLPWYDGPAALLPFVLSARAAVVERLMQSSELQNAWVIAGLPDAREREQLAAQLGAKVIVLAVPAAECLRRIQKDERRSAALSAWREIVHRWWQDYRPRAGDMVLDDR